MVYTVLNYPFHFRSALSYPTWSPPYLVVRLLLPTLPPPSLSSSLASCKPAKYIPSLSHHLLVTRNTSLWSTSKQSSIIGRVAMYCATIFWRLDIYVSISSKPTSCIASFNRGYYQVPSYQRRGCFPDILRATLWWKPPAAAQLVWSQPKSLSQRAGRTALWQGKNEPTSEHPRPPALGSLTVWPRSSAPSGGWKWLPVSHCPTLWGGDPGICMVPMYP